VAEAAANGVSLTTSLADKPFPASVPVMVAVPAAMAVTSPLVGSTVAMVASLEA
jgi:hypothetical protein